GRARGRPAGAAPPRDHLVRGRGRGHHDRPPRPARDRRDTRAVLTVLTEPLVPSSLLRRLEQLQLVSKARLAGTSRGERRSRHRGPSLQFVDYRQYALGDDPRQVDWNAYGRTGHLFVKLFEDEAMLTVHLLVDVSRSMDWGEP